MAKYKTYAKEKRLYFLFSVLAYFLPFIAVTACFLPMVQAAKGFKIAMGLGIVFINAIPFLMGVFRSIFAHFPMLNVTSIIFVCLAAFFTLDVFKSCVDKLLWIESAAAIGSLVSCFMWVKYNKYAAYQKSMKATIGSGAFVLKEDMNNDS